jgi:putative ubiquitin-RnfH superfamily antitoxin RatB of RatAB toxin-antitoxin module
MASLQVEIVYAQPQRSMVKSLALEPGSTVEDALALAVLDSDFSAIDLAAAPIGIFGRVVSRDRALEDGDRIEVYRPLTEEPIIARRRRAQQRR